MRRKILAKPAARTDIDGFEATVIGAGLHPADGRLVVVLRMWDPHSNLPWQQTLHQRADGSWGRAKVPAAVVTFLAGGGPGVRRRVSGRWWTVTDSRDVPARIVW